MNVGSIETELFKIKDEMHFRSIFDEYFASLYYYACRIINDDQVAEDLVQEIFLELWKKKDEVYINKIASYLYTSVRYRCMNHLRHEKVKNTYKSTSIQENGNKPLDDSVAMIEEEMVREIYKLIHLMPDQRKTVFLLYLEGFSQHEIAKEMNVSINTVKTHKLKARQFLREHLKNSLYIILLIKFDSFF